MHPAADLEPLQRAAKFAALHHRNQEREGGVPYFSHPVRVCLTLTHVFGIDDPATLCAALLHDLIEDTPVDYDDILQEFGEEVANLVAGMSKDMRMREDLREPAYDEQIHRGSWKLKALKLADTYDNLSDATDRKRAKALEKAQRALASAEGEDRLATAAERLESLIAAAGS